jgi:hypothetical protein
MTPEQFRSSVHDILQTSGADILVQLPSGSGICHIATVPASNWISGFVSQRAGRWGLPDEPMKYYGDGFRTCAAESFGTDTAQLDACVFEHWRLKQPVVSFNISRFPQPLQNAFFEDRGSAPDKWGKPHIFIEEARLSPYFSGVSSVYAPTASGQALGIGGMVFATNDPCGVAELLKTGSYKDWLDEQP